MNHREILGIQSNVTPTMCDLDTAYRITKKRKDHSLEEIEEAFRVLSGISKEPPPTVKKFYSILGLTSESPSGDELKKAYKISVLKYHPDLNPHNDKEEADRLFTEVFEAFQVLLDPQKKKIYDAHGEEGLKSAASEHRDRKRRKVNKSTTVGKKCNYCTELTKNVDELAKELTEAKDKINILEAEKKLEKDCILNYSDKLSASKSKIAETNHLLETSKLAHKSSVKSKDLLVDFLLQGETVPSHLMDIQCPSLFKDNFIKEYQSNAFKRLRTRLDADSAFVGIYKLSTEEIRQLMLSSISQDHWIYPVVKTHITQILVEFAIDLKLTAPWFITPGSSHKPGDNLWFVRHNHNKKLKQSDTGGVSSTCDILSQVFKKMEKTTMSDSDEVLMMRACAHMCLTVLSTMQRSEMNQLVDVIQMSVHQEYATS